MTTIRQLRALFVVMMRQGGPLGVFIRKYDDRERWLRETRLMLDEYYLGIKPRHFKVWLHDLAGKRHA